MTTKLAWMLAPVLLLASACTKHEPADPKQVSPVGKTFVSETSTVNLVPGTKIRLRFTADGALDAQAGCNHLGTKVSLDDGILTTEDGFSGTDMGCTQEGQKQDDWLAAFLRGKPTWRYDGTTLTLHGGDDEIVLTAD